MNFLGHVQKNKLTNQDKQRKALFGKKIRIIGNSNNHNWGLIGTVVEITQPIVTSIAFNGNAVTGLVAPGSLGMCNTWLSFVDFELLENTLESIKGSIKFNNEEIKRLEREVELLKKKQDYLEYNELHELDDRQFLAYEIVQVMRSEDDDKKKAKAIAELLP